MQLLMQVFEPSTGVDTKETTSVFPLKGFFFFFNLLLAFKTDMKTVFPALQKSDLLHNGSQCTDCASPKTGEGRDNGQSNALYINAIPGRSSRLSQKISFRC